MTMAEDKTVRVVIPFENMNVGDTFTMSETDQRFQSLLGAGYLEEVREDDNGNVESAGPQPSAEARAQHEEALRGDAERLADGLGSEQTTTSTSKAGRRGKTGAGQESGSDS